MTTKNNLNYSDENKGKIFVHKGTEYIIRYSYLRNNTFVYVVFQEEGEYGLGGQHGDEIEVSRIPLDSLK